MNLLSIVLLLGAIANVDVLADDVSYVSYHVADDGNVPNPKGDGFIPIPQRGKWKGLDEFEWNMDSYDWNENTKVRNRDNECRDRSLGKEDKGTHRQSPVILQYDGKRCMDEHKMHGNHNPGHMCSANQIEYHVTNHNLRADFSHCTQTPFMDVSNSRFLWDLQYIEVVCPSNHVRINKDGNGYRRSDCELVIAHSGTDEHKRRMFHLGVLLEGDDDEDDHNELEKYLKGWESKQKAEYLACGLDWEADLCSLKHPPTSKPSTKPTAKLTTRPTARHSLFPSRVSSSVPSASPSPSPSPFVPAGRKNIRKLKEDDKAKDKAKENDKAGGGNTDKNKEKDAEVKNGDTAKADGNKPNGDGDKVDNTKADDGNNKNNNINKNDKQGAATATDGDTMMEDDMWLSKNLVLLQTTNFNSDTNGIPYDHTNQLKPYQLFRNTESDYYYRYQGSLTHPPCSETVMWAVMRRTLKISTNQVNRLENLVAKHVERDTNGQCYFGTVGRERNDGSCKVDVNRELQYKTQIHNMTDCTEWVTKPPSPAPAF